ncbi:acetyl-CoA carboxylase biotin carboxylase subunit [bacterium]|nr:acetyl-CoA carboxylase biotin carboxylase subunit [bacterium]
MIGSVLIANRGEIAVRIARTCREMGIRMIGVYSEADRHALHVETMDEAYPVGPAPSAESYLRQDRILEVAAKAQAEAVHPGYGFLAENAEFAQRVVDAGLIWIGPPASAIAAMGSKTQARAIMSKAGVPVVPGSEGAISSVEEADAFARRVGYPVLIKAVAGGGGKGMRVVESSAGLRNAFEAARREALAAFGDGSVYVEKYLAQPRHIEIQILADTHGNVIHLGERECSIQRRHQKIIEESPSVAVTPELRRRMGETAVAAARACGYVNAGTVETIMDRDGHFYFLEMNTRLQVEHPVTEEVTGLDLVRLQILITSGEKLPLRQEDIVRRGHAIEIRVYAEDVPNGFLPSTGKLKRLKAVAGPGVREDSGLREGDEVTRFYDPMLGKLIVHAETREAARQRAIRVLRESEVAGVRSNLPFCLHILETAAFERGDFHTRSADGVFLDSYLAEIATPAQDEALLAAALAYAAAMPRTVSDGNSHSLHSDSHWLAVGRRQTMRGSVKG